MDYFAGLDASLETVNVCIVDGDGSVLLEQKVGAEPRAIVALLKQFGRPLKRIGLEAGPMSSWLFTELRTAGFPALCRARRSARQYCCDYRTFAAGAPCAPR
jgi:transposase